jgi:Ca-activated chloride channel family protein
MSWAAPAYAWLCLLAVPVIALVAWDWRRQKQVMRRLIGNGAYAAALTASSPGARFSKGLLPSAIFIFIILALCRPQWGTVAEEHRSKGLDIIIALDTSRSMLADDQKPSRLAAAKEAIDALVAALQGDRIGLLAFAGSAFLICPLTTDYGAFGKTLAETGVETIPLGGTSLAAALTEAVRAFPGGAGHGRALILISDGEDHGESFNAAARKLRDAGVIIHTVAAGTTTGGLIPLSAGNFLKDRTGVVIRSRMQPAVLQTIAATLGGRRLNLNAGRTVLADLYTRDLANMERKEIDNVRQRRKERFQVPLAFALALLAVEPFLRKRRKT